MLSICWNNDQWSLSLIVFILVSCLTLPPQKNNQNSPPNFVHHYHHVLYQIDDEKNNV